MVINQLRNAFSMGNGNNSQLGTRTPTYRGVQGSPKTLTEDDLMDGDVSITAGEKELIGRFVVPSQTFAETGQGDPSLDPQEQGRPLIDLQDSNASDDVLGEIEIRHESATGKTSLRVVNDTLGAFRTSTRSERLVLPRARTSNVNPVREDSQISLFFIPSAVGTGTVSKSDTKIELPITIYEK